MFVAAASMSGDASSKLSVADRHKLASYSLTCPSTAPRTVVHASRLTPICSGEGVGAILRLLALDACLNSGPVLFKFPEFLSDFISSFFQPVDAVLALLDHKHCLLHERGRGNFAVTNLAGVR